MSATQASIGLFGGTFDPFHLGHLHIAMSAKRLLQLTEVRLIPCQQNPLKKHAPYSSPEDRAQMLQLVAEEYPGLTLDRIELERPGPSYTIDTLKAIRQKIGPDVPLCLIIASDVAYHFTDWKDWRHITDYAHLVLVPRPSFTQPLNDMLTTFIASHHTDNPEILQNTPCGFVHELGIENQKNISATNIRHTVQTTHTVPDLVPESIKRYIIEHHLYQPSQQTGA